MNDCCAVELKHNSCAEEFPSLYSHSHNNIHAIQATAFDTKYAHLSLRCRASSPSPSLSMVSCTPTSLGDETGLLPSTPLSSLFPHCSPPLPGKPSTSVPQMCSVQYSTVDQAMARILVHPVMVTRSWTLLLSTTVHATAS